MNSSTDRNLDRSQPTRGFWALIVTQFQGAFSDNVVKKISWCS
ncbi:MAG: hypothetical protein WDN00_14710 [Limisphaerales bacterium]